MAYLGCTLSTPDPPETILNLAGPNHRTAFVAKYGIPSGGFKDPAVHPKHTPDTILC